ncbi:MAG: class I SAM-dependent methyltransferase [Chloroflexi bacterium]|nr:class I SAM-dependent methyltransferase [Chloroflexota bacterium]
MNDQTAYFAGNIERFSGYADSYDKYRPAPPALLDTVLTRWARVPVLDLVVDLGSGTGLSTRYWADKARQVIGIEPTDDMRRQAQAQTVAPNVSYRPGFSHQTGLPDRCAQIVTCAQSLHWMDPQATFEEVARVLCPGGVFAASDYDWPPTTGQWEADAAYEACMQQVQACLSRYRSQTQVRQWDKQAHLRRMQDSGCFRYMKEIALHHVEPGNAERLAGLLLSQGGVMTLLKAGFHEDQLGIDVFREVAQRTLGPEPRPWYWSSRVRLGIV